MLPIFYILLFWLEVCGILAYQAGIKPTLPASEGKVLTTGPPEKSLGASCLAFQ